MEAGKENGGNHYQCQKHETEKYKSINDDRYAEYQMAGIPLDEAIIQ